MQSVRGKTELKNLPDSDLVPRILDGDGTAFELLMRRYNRPLYRVARSIVKNDADAEDVLQKSYLLAYRAMGKFRGESNLSTWLTRIVVNESIARSRKTARHAEIIDINETRQWDDVAAETQMMETKTEQPEQAASRSETRRLVEKNIDGLPEAFRTVFVLRALEEMSVEETAACLGIPEATVRTRYFRARGLLREALAREIDFAIDDAFSFDGARCDRIVNGVLRRWATLPR